MASKKVSSLRSLLSKNPLPQVRGSRRYKNVVSFIEHRPFTAFFVTLGVLLLIIILSSVLSTLGKKEPLKKAVVREVHVFNIGKTPTVTLQAQIEDNGVAKIVAQGAGVVSAIHIAEGESVYKGQTLVSLSSTYQGDNAPALQSELAAAQLQNSKDTIGLQKDMIAQQRFIATASAENAEQLRQISISSLNETRDQLTANDAILAAVTAQINTLTAINPADPEIQALKGQQAQLQAGVNQLRSAVRSLEYSTNTANPPVLLSNSQKDLTLKQLSVQEKALDLGQEATRIQYALSLVQQNLMYPATPFAGVVERINVQIGQAITPGTLIATVTANNRSSNAVLRAPRDIAQSLSRTEPSTIHIGTKSFAILPTYVSSVATDNQLYSVTYALPDAAKSLITDAEYVQIDIPIGVINTSATDPFVPIDSVYESENESTVYLKKGNRAMAQKIETGNVYGGFVEVLRGLTDGDQVILDRNVVAGDTIKVIR